MARSMSTNGAALRVIRERSRFGVRDLRDALAKHHDVHVHEDHIRNIEIGRRNAGPKLLNAIAAVLKVPVVALLAEPVRASASGAVE